MYMRLNYDMTDIYVCSVNGTPLAVVSILYKAELVSQKLRELSPWISRGYHVYGAITSLLL